MKENPVTNSKNSIVNFYRDQLRKFNNLGIGMKTENRVLITQKLIDITRKRLAELSVTYEQSLSKETVYSRVYWRNKRMNTYNRQVNK